MNTTINKSNVSLSKNQSQRQPVCIADGRVAGYILGDTFTKHVADKNILWYPKPALCLDNGVVFKLRRLGVKTIQVKHKENGSIWTISLAEFTQKARPENRGNAGAQFCCFISLWNSNNTTESPSMLSNKALRSPKNHLISAPGVIQPSLFGGGTRC